MASLGKQIADFFSGDSTNNNDEGLRGLFINELKGVYYAERQAVDALGDQADAATTDVVRNAFLQHQEESRNQITRLERVFDSIGVEADEMTCEAIDGLAEDAQKVIANTETGSLTRDAGLIIAAQKVEHHEIAAYGSLHTLARLLGYTEAASLIEQTLREEKNTDRKLTEIAESFINERARSEGRDVSEYGSRYRDNDDDNMVTPDGTRYDQGTGSQGTYGSGSMYGSGSQSGSSTTYGGGSGTMGGTSMGSGSMGSSQSSGTGYSSDRDATLGGTSGI